jgi:hypothetical protein
MSSPIANADDFATANCPSNDLEVLREQVGYLSRTLELPRARLS